MNRVFLRVLALLFLLTAGGVAMPAQDLAGVRDSMRQRLPQLDELKASGAVGEDNRGYVAVRESRDNAADIVAAENSDRRVVYQSIAKQTGSTAEAVGKARARQIAAQSASGVWLQRENGQWYQK